MALFAVCDLGSAGPAGPKERPTPKMNRDLCLNTGRHFDRVGPMARAIWNDTVIAESDDTVVIEGNHYFPARGRQLEVPEGVEAPIDLPLEGRGELLLDRGRRGAQSRRGLARLEPLRPAAKIKGRIAFWHGVKVTA